MEVGHPAVWPQRTWAESWGAMPLQGRGELGPHLTQCRLSWDLPSYQVVSWCVWPQYTWTENWRGVPLFGGTGSPSNRTSPGPRPTSVPSGILIDPPVWPQQTWAENWGLWPPFFGELCPHLAWAETYLHTKWHLDAASRLATVEMGGNMGTSAPFFGRGSWVPI